MYVPVPNYSSRWECLGLQFLLQTAVKVSAGLDSIIILVVGLYENNLWNNPSHQRYIHLPRYHHHVIHLDFGSTPAVTKSKARISRYIIFRRCDAKISVDEREDADADVDSNESKPRYK